MVILLCIIVRIIDLVIGTIVLIGKSVTIIVAIELVLAMVSDFSMVIGTIVFLEHDQVKT